MMKVESFTYISLLEVAHNTHYSIIVQPVWGLYKRKTENKSPFHFSLVVV